MSIPMRREREVRLREFFNSEYKFITVLPAWQTFDYKAELSSELDDVLFARCKDILVDPERYFTTVNSWLAAHLEDFQRVYAALIAEYDPISNYNMIEQEGEISKEAEKISQSKRYGTDRVASTIPESRSDRFTTTFDSDTEGKLDSYTVDSIIDAPTLEGHKAQITESTQEADGSGRQGTEISETHLGVVDIYGPESMLTGDRGSERELTRSGNIGVTTSQQMLESEITLRAKYSFINYFCDKFTREMTIGVWDL